MWLWQPMLKKLLPLRLLGSGGAQAVSQGSVLGPQQLAPLSVSLQPGRPPLSVVAVKLGVGSHER